MAPSSTSIPLMSGLFLSISMISVVYNLNHWYSPATTSVYISSAGRNVPKNDLNKRGNNNQLLLPTLYRPSTMETYLLEHSPQLGFHHVTAEEADSTQQNVGCQMWKNATLTDIYNDLQVFRKELKEYETLLSKFLAKQTIPDVRREMNKFDGNDTTSVDICQSLNLHPDGLAGIFTASSSLSQLPQGGGYIEPLLPPLRHPEFCFNRRQLMNLGYLIHDFAALCQHHIYPDSRTVFIDMGASLDFHASQQSPAMYIIKTFQQAGIPFDHIYGYEITPKQPNDVYERIPTSLKHAYHWFNVGVNASMESEYNPLVSILLEQFTPHDFVVVKLDIDTSSIEVPMVQLILQNKDIADRIDVLYFEHHVLVSDMAPWWKRSRKGSVLESFKIFTQLRETGIAAHYWP
ncbi:hypothetical protein IV203_037013 [Nitzschia inconspicua]|uniref:Uncharacterized protein n=1 Tax=Nitzschia inconspicua TaxID=303405 RepID=A0A9K3K5Y9_9STRA|nr:hypothetical protein IV203_037013 [Nitzschia inconspicua]